MRGRQPGPAARFGRPLSMPSVDTKQERNNGARLRINLHKVDWKEPDYCALFTTGFVVAAILQIVYLWFRFMFRPRRKAFMLRSFASVVSQSVGQSTVS